MNFRNTLGLAALVSLFSVSALADQCKHDLEAIQPSAHITDFIKASTTHHVYKFVKDQPILGYRITTNKFSDIPAEIRDVMGAVDATKYTEAYLGENIGSVIALQMDGAKPDFYVIGKGTYDSKYKDVSLNDFASKNSGLLKKLQNSPASPVLARNDGNLVALLKTVPVEMVRMSQLGFPIADKITIESPWGEQTKPAGQDAFLTFDSGKGLYYMVNSNAEGLPQSYVPAK